MRAAFYFNAAVVYASTKEWVYLPVHTVKFYISCHVTDRSIMVMFVRHHNVTNTLVIIVEYCARYGDGRCIPKVKSVNIY